MELNYNAGQVIKLTQEVTVILGQVVTVNLHPSGTQFDGPAVVVAAYLGSSVPSVPIVKVVSLSDPALREVVRLAKDVI